METTRNDGLARELRRLEDEIRARSYRARSEGGAAGGFRAHELLDALEDRTLLEIVQIEDRLHVLLCAHGRVRRFPAGAALDALAELEHIRSGLRWLSYQATQERLAMAETCGRRLQDLLLGAAPEHLGASPVVVVPPAHLHGVPWAVLPALRHRVHAAAPSADAWLRTRNAGPATATERVVLVRGPGLAWGRDEVSALAAVHDAPIVLDEGQATTDAVLAAIDGCGLAHLVAHGTFRSDNPMFSALRLDDGPLSVHDLERLRRAPRRIVLPCCDSAQLQRVGADELLGLAAALLPLGTAGIVAAVVPVNDQAVVPLMLTLHRTLKDGGSMAVALNKARRHAPEDPLHQATALSFVAIGEA